MTLDDAIAYYDEVAEKCRRKANIERNDYMDLKDNASEAEQLADWLNELKLLRDRIEIQHGPCEDAVSRAELLSAFPVDDEPTVTKSSLRMTIKRLPSVTPKEQRWVPVTLETLPNPNSIVVVCSKKGTWDFGRYSGWYGDIHSWKWKNNTIKHVYWWMYKTDALPEPYREEGDE